MKRLSILLATLIAGFSLSLNAQTNLTQAVDFTATDVHGNQIHLFDILDNGQYVLIDFFFTTCSGCIETTPLIAQAYSAFGCNMHDVFFIEVDYGDSQAQCQNWVNQYGIEYPTIPGTSGGSNITNQYGVDGFPTVILIAPNHQIVIQDLWPMSNLQTIINALQAQGVQQHDCNAAGYVAVSPETLNVTISDDGITPGQLTIENHTEDDLTIAPFTVDEVFSSLECVHDGNDVTQGLTVAAGETITIEVFVDIDLPVKENFTGNLYVNTSAGEYVVSIVLDYTVGVDESSIQPLKVYPNPASESLTIETEGSALLVDQNGRIVRQLTVNGKDNINLQGLSKGVYFLKTGKNVTKVLVK